jgi:hypothetical protein
VNFAELADWLEQELQAGRLTLEQVLDLLAQRTLFDRDRSWIETEFDQKVVGYIANERTVTESTPTILQRAAQMFPGRMLYFEPIGFRIF